MQVIGAKLQVPPDFFASHWIAPGYNGDLVNQPLRHYDNKYRFRLGFSRLHQARVEALAGDEKSPFYQMDSVTRRIVSRTTIFGDEDGPVVSAEQVSFWSRLDGENWDGMLFWPFLALFSFYHLLIFLILFLPTCLFVPLNLASLDVLGD
jgi:hypothetical protein